MTSPPSGPRPVRPLPPEVIERIAAGEVILGPAAAVKELAENALDAGASLIEIELRRGGLDLIRVRDDGAGIPPDQLEAAFLRHATSKIAALDDLDGIRSYGFRGEALASLAAVADVALTSAVEPGQGVRVEYEGGALVRRERQARGRGVTVAVRRLFQNMPARLAMLDDTRRELAAVALLVRRLALAAPGVRFVLTVDGRMDFRSPGDGRRESALAAWYGADTAAMLVPLAEARPGGARLSGWISGPERSWTGRRHLHLYVNGRWVEPRPLLAALEQGYRPLLPRGRHPLAAVFLDLPPSLVDLNVHPAKLDVRLRWEAETAAGLAAAVRDALSSRLAAPREDDWLALPPEMTETGGIGEGAERAIAEASEPYGGWVRGPRLPQMRLLGQARGALLLAEGPQGLYLLDQHRMHERVLYDRLRAAHPHGPALDLPSPLVVDLPGGRFGGALRERLEAAGFVCRSFAGRAFVVAAAPGLPDWTPEPDALLAALHESAPDEDGWEDRLFAALACRTAVRRGAGLSDELQHRLLAGLAQSEQPGVCPHGSPAILHLSPSFLERRFRW